jgi:exodeoxyribonuclease VII large subunit
MSGMDELFDEITGTAPAAPAAKPTETVFSVSEFSNMLKGALEEVFGRVKVRGEIMGLRRHSSGTCYFDLKESAGGRDYILNCVLWKWTRIEARLEEGLEVIITGKATAYTGRSSYQLSVEAAEIAGAGALFKIIEDRKKKLAAEGLFDPARKKPIPKFPRIIGVVTSPTGAVIRDIIHRISGRFPARIIVWPTLVQGEGADAGIAAAIAGFNRMAENRPDVLIVARGGGSLQDLMPFNEEIVVRAAADSEIPVISAVGHETDTTLIDYAADLRAPTPTAAAELAVADRSDLLLRLRQCETRILNTTLRRFENFTLRIKSLSGKLKNPLQFIMEAVQRLDEKTARMELMARGRLASATDRVAYAAKMLESYSFRNVLGRGYAIVWSGTEVVGSTSALAGLGSATLEMSDGKIGILAKTPEPPAGKRKRPDRPEDGKQRELF